MSFNFSHIINPVSEKENPELFAAQKITFQSIAESRKRLKGNISVELIAVSFPEANSVSEKIADKTIPLLRSVADIKKFNRERKLPIIHDLLSEGIKNASHDYIVFTNIDIALMPDFYNVVNWYCEKGHDAVVINRRRIPNKLKNAPLEVMQAHAGYMHTGYDCFIFKKSLFEKFVPTNICIGIPPAGNDIFYNLFTFAENPLLLTERHLTFHLGMELVKIWGSSEYYHFNYSEFSKLLKKLDPHIDIAKFPGAELSFFKRHFKWLMNPTLYYPQLFRKDFSKSSKRKNKSKPEVKQKFYEWLIRKINFRDREE
jgi:hypothetical protein